MRFEERTALFVGPEGSIPQGCPNYLSLEDRDIPPHGFVPTVLVDVWRRTLGGGLPVPWQWWLGTPVWAATWRAAWIPPGR